LSRDDDARRVPGKRSFGKKTPTDLSVWQDPANLAAEKPYNPASEKGNHCPCIKTAASLQSRCNNKERVEESLDS